MICKATVKKYNYKYESQDQLRNKIKQAMEVARVQREDVVNKVLLRRHALQVMQLLYREGK